MSDLVTTSELSGPKFLLLEPGSYPARSGDIYNRILETEADILEAIQDAWGSDVIALDYETEGNDFSRDIKIIGVGLAWDRGSCYFEGHLIPDLFIDLLKEHKGLIAHNVMFDGGVTKKVLGFHPDWLMCTFTMLAMLHNESPESRWGLKDAQINLLGWSESNERELDEWLILNEYYIGVKRVDSSPENLLAQYNLKKIRPDKSKMHLAPTEILGKYCCLDADSTYLLFTEVLRPKSKEFPGFWEFLQLDQMFLIRTLIDQKILGIPMDISGLNELGSTLLKEADELTDEFLFHPETRPHIVQLEKEYLRPLQDRQIEKYTKSGAVSKNWLKWQNKLIAATNGEDPEYLFNIQSAMQMRELLYGRLGYSPKILTDAGLPSTSGKAVKGMGQPGNLLLRRADSVKCLTYINKYLELLTECNRDTIHPSFRGPGTVTGRLTSKEPNLQQVEKSKRMMELFQARPGKVWVDLDFSALEPTVTTEFSGDPNMELIYGNGRPSNDIYIFVMSSIPGMGDKTRLLGYDPKNPSPESLARVKKEMKHERGICKTVVLACISEGTLIRVKDRGLVRIENVINGDEVWDGVNWVKTTGAIDKGKRGCNYTEQVLLTDDHLILDTENNWNAAKEYRKICSGTKTPQPIKLKRASASWSDIWKVVCSFFSS